MTDHQEAFPSYKAEAWVRRRPGVRGKAGFEWAHAWCLPTLYVRERWVANGGDFEVFDDDTCLYCESSMMKEPYQ